MATTIKYHGREIKLTSKKQGTAYLYQGNYLKEHHRIFVTIDDKRIQFEYYCNEVKLKEDDLLSALYCFILDGIAYHNTRSFNDFCDGLGYIHNAESMRVYKACRRQYDKWQELCNINICDFAKWMQDNFNV